MTISHVLDVMLQDQSMNSVSLQVTYGRDKSEKFVNNDPKALSLPIIFFKFF